MSRINQALRLAQSADGVSAPDTEARKPETGGGIGQYPSEEAESRQPDRTGGEAARDTQVPDHAGLPALRLEAASDLPPPEDAERRERLVTTTSNVATLEQYRRIAAVLHDEQVQHQLKTVMITSPLPHDGKTLTVVNLGLTLSESYGRRVVLVDADLRLPSLHTVLGVKNERGLCEALDEEASELQFTSVSSHLSVLTAGTPGPAPLAALASPRMGRVLAQCAAHFDWVLIDTSPLGVLPDAQVLVRQVGEVILVVGAGSTPAAAVTRAIEELGGPDAILGIVLNRVEDHRIPAASYYGQYGTSAARLK
jgi:capsular exopolysaccharide synthesis family protein